MKYKCESTIVEAVQFENNSESIRKLHDLLGKDEMLINYQDLNNPFIPIKVSKGRTKLFIGDYLIKEKKGIFRIMSNTAFERIYTEINELNKMNFGEAVEILKKGGAVCRPKWKGTFIVKQVPSLILEGTIPTMQSLPQSAKELILSRKNKFINYTNQLLIVYSDGHADSWVPSIDDVLAEDWEIILP